MSGNVRKLVFEFLGKPADMLPEHVQTVKISATAHAKLRALADFAGRSKTPLAADLLMAAIDDAIEALPNEPLDEATADKLRGVTQRWGLSELEDGDTTYVFHPNTMREIALERADNYLSFDEQQRDKEAVESVAADSSKQNGAHK
jgi:hypothetical protein